MSEHGNGNVKRFGGEDPDKYPGWKRWVRAHLKAKKVEEGCRGATVYTFLDGIAAKACEDIPEHRTHAHDREPAVEPCPGVPLDTCRQAPRIGTYFDHRRQVVVAEAWAPCH